MRVKATEEWADQLRQKKMHSMMLVVNIDLPAAVLEVLVVAVLTVNESASLGTLA